MTHKFTTWQEIRAAERLLDEQYHRCRDWLREEEERISKEEQEKRITAAKISNAPIVEAWKLRLKDHRYDPSVGGRYIFTVKFADGTGNSYHYLRGTTHPITGEPYDPMGKIEAFFVEGLPFEHEPSNWLNDDHLYDIVKIDPKDVPPFDRF